MCRKILENPLSRLSSKPVHWGSILSSAASYTLRSSTHKVYVEDEGPSHYKKQQKIIYKVYVEKAPPHYKNEQKIYKINTSPPKK